MNLFSQPWGELIARIRRSFADLILAELHALRVELRETGRHVVWIAVLAGFLSLVAFWASGMLLVLLTVGLNAVLPLWGAVTVVLGFLVGALLVLGLVIRSRYRQLVLPANVIRVRVTDHLEFWRRQAVGIEYSDTEETMDEDDDNPERWVAPKSVRDDEALDVEDPDAGATS